MSIPNTTRLSQLESDIKGIIENGILDFAKLSGKIFSDLEDKKQVMQDEVTKVMKDLDQSAHLHTQLEKEIEKFSTKKVEFIEREANLRIAEEDVKKERQELLELHQALENKRNIMGERETKLKERERRAQE